MNKAPVFFVAVLALAASVFAHSGCGTTRFIQSFREMREAQASLQAQKIARSTSATCKTEDFYDSVHTKKTAHFQILYTLEGPHKTTQPFIDTLASALEYAWKFHVQKTGMLQPLGDSVSYHYQKKIEPGLYPVEVAEITLLRDLYSYVKTGCNGCYGLTIPHFDRVGLSNLIIDNDFKFPTTVYPQKDSINLHGKNCTYYVSDQELYNITHNYSYAKKWDKALQVTTAHELYHAIQLRYLDMGSYWTFWFEASAAGVEEIVRPDIDDYISYLKNLSASVGVSLENLSDDYGASVLYLFLYNHVSSNIDKSIWESFSKKPNESFQYHLTQASRKKGLSADSLFHEMAVRLSFSGKRINLADTSFWINKDQSNWPEFKHTSTSSRHSIPQTSELAYNFYTNGKPDLADFIGKASVAIIKKNSYEIRFLPTLNSVDSAIVDINKTTGIDSVVWILSRLDEDQKLPYAVADSTLRAFPVPWRNGSLCFAPLPANKDFIEIRNRRGNLVLKEKYDNNMLCLEESRVKELMVPGVYRFRAGNKGKLKDFIVVY